MLSDTDRMILRRLRQALASVQQHVPAKFTISSLQALLAVAEEPGLGGNEYAEKTGLSLTTVVQQLKDMTDHTKSRRLDHVPLIRSGKDVMDQRRSLSYLTDRGERIVSSIVMELKGAIK